MRSPQHRGPFVACVALTVGCGAFLGHALSTYGIVETFTEPISMAQQEVADAIRLDPDTSGTHAAVGPAVFHTPASVVVVPATSDLAVSSLVSTTGHGPGGGDQPRPGGSGNAHGNGGSNGSGPTAPGSSNGSASSTGQGNNDGQGGSDQHDRATASGAASSVVPTLTSPSGKTAPGQVAGLATVSAAVGHGQASAPVDARRVADASLSSTTVSTSTVSTSVSTSVVSTSVGSPDSADSSGHDRV
ncbi:MAG TPA: hypothetical protein VFQ15_07460, partial [Jiangellaceae bacterium]|nr:hypothetical protein [Jiangellaceae bacterium]